MNTTIPNETDLSLSTTITGGRKNKTVKKHKKGNKVLAAWRDHVKVVAKTEGITYGKEAMQMAKKGNHGKEWAKIKATLHGGATEEASKVEEEPKVDEESKVEEEIKVEEEPVAEQINDTDADLPDAGTAQQLYGGKRRRSSKKSKTKKGSKKSKKHHKSRKH